MYDKPILRAEKVKKIYGKKENEIEALRGVDLDICEGEFISIMGSSGAGKSTLLLILAGMDKPTAGEVFYCDRSLYSFNDFELAKYRGCEIGVVFQKDNLIDELSVVDNILLPARLYGKNITQNDGLKWIKVLGIERKKTAFPNEISGGQLQKAAIARALINQPKILFLDEPTGNLDKESGEQLLNLLTRLSDKGHSIILVTHDIEVAIRSEKIYYMQDGMLIRKLNLGKYTYEDSLNRKNKLFEFINIS